MSISQVNIREASVFWDVTGFQFLYSLSPLPSQSVDLFKLF